MSADDKLNLLKDMMALIGDAVLEGQSREQFQALVARFEELSAKPKAATKRATKASAYAGSVPDIHAEFSSRSQQDFLAWASSLELPLLKRIVKTEQFDPSGRSRSWRKGEKFAELIAEQMEREARAVLVSPE